MESFKDKVILITGGSSGLGAATALRFARDGAKVAIGSRRVEQSEAVVRQIESLGGQACSFAPMSVGGRTSKLWSPAPSPVSAASIAPSTMLASPDRFSHRLRILNRMPGMKH